MIAALARDVRYASRSLRSRRSYALLSILTIALIVGAGSAVFAVASATLVRGQPFPRADRLVRLFTLPPDVHQVADRNPLSALDFVRFRQRVTQLESIAGIWQSDHDLAGGAEPESVPGGRVSANFFSVLDAAPAFGRTFTEDEEQANAKVVVLSYGIWQRRFGGDPAAVGRTLSIDREGYQIVGVMGPDFNPGYVPSQLWTPLGVREGNLVQPAATFIQTIARMRPGVTLSQVNTELGAVMAGVTKEQASLQAGWTSGAVSLRDWQFGTSRPALMLLLAAIAALALIAVANLTNLAVADVSSRWTDLTLRAALGAGRGDLVRIQVVETAVLAAAGGLMGVGVAAWCLPAVLALDPTIAHALGRVTVDWRVQAAAFCLSLGVSFTAGVLPVLSATRGDLARSLSQGSRRAVGSRSGRRMRFVLVAAETLLSAVLVTSGALVLSAFDRTARTDPGFDPHHVLVGQMRLSPIAYPTAGARVEFVRNVLARVKATPGVIEASSVQNPFLPGFAWVTLVQIEGKLAPDGRPHTVQFRRITPGYFRAMRIPELRGRTFEERDDAATQPVAVVSQSFAARFWPGEDAMGRRVARAADPSHWLTVIGIVGDVSDAGFGQPPAPTLYVTYAQNNIATATVTVVARTAGDPDASVRAVEQAIQSADRNEPLSSITTLDRFLSDSLGPQRFRSLLLLVFAGLGLMLAAVGIYGVTSRSVVERTREMGVRLALGCETGRLWRLVVRQSLAAVGLGFAVGLVAALGVDAMLRHWLAGLDSARPWVVAPALAVLAAAGFAAAALPARRAMRVDPLVALRAD